MKHTFKKPILILLFIIIFLLISDCSALKNIDFFHDKINPCSEGPYFDDVECEYWKTHYPKDYNKFIERLKKDSVQFNLLRK